MTPEQNTEEMRVRALVERTLAGAVGHLLTEGFVDRMQLAVNHQLMSCAWEHKYKVEVMGDPIGRVLNATINPITSRIEGTIPV